MKILITGGHFSPAYALIEEFKKRGHEIVVIGRRFPFENDKSESYEYEVCKKENIEFVEIKTGRYQRKFTAYTISSLLKTPNGFFQARKQLSRIKPDAVLTFGGYIGLPVAYAARLSGIPVVLHEQTQHAGLASKLISKVANNVCISFISSQNLFPARKTIFTGDPLRPEVFRVKKKLPIPDERKKIIYITGGSTGSHFINNKIYDVAVDLLENYILVHQTGDSVKFGDFEKLEKLRNSLPPEKKKRYILKKFIFPEEIGYVLDEADLLVSRSGANTVFEIMAKKKISLLIPLPYGQNNEQLANAKLLQKIGIGEYVLEADADSQMLKMKIKEMIENNSLYLKNMDKAESYVVKDSAQKIAEIVESYGKKSS